jgi:hypothetical protein
MEHGHHVAGRWSAEPSMESGMADTSRTRVTRCGITSNTWRAVNGTRWDAVLGLLQADSGHGPNMKFEARSKLYDFPLGSKVIRAVD